MIESNTIKAYLVDDEPLALKRLTALLDETGRVTVVGSSVDPAAAQEEIPGLGADVLFVDIKMPGTNGFELLEQLGDHPPVIFTTAYSEHSLDAFEYFSVDYLLKPVDRIRLGGALDKIDRIKKLGDRELGKLFRKISANDKSGNLARVYSRVGAKVQLIDIADVTHFFSEDKVTFAATVHGDQRPVDQSLTRLEKDLDAGRFMRVHRSTIVNLESVKEVNGWFSSGVLISLKDSQIKIKVARSRVSELKKKLGM